MAYEPNRNNFAAAAPDALAFLGNYLKKEDLPGPVSATCRPPFLMSTQKTSKVRSVGSWLWRFVN